MGSHQFIKRTRIEAPADEVFAWHARPGALERLTPPWEAVEVVERTGGIEPGARVVLAMHAGPIPTRWVAEHRALDPGRSFQDVMVKGPFWRWEHTHSFEPDGPDACILEDRIEYALPPGGFVAHGWVRGRIERMFEHRHAITARDLALHRALATGGPRRVLVTGASGLIGSSLVPLLTTGGHEVVVLGRGPAAEGTRTWDPAEGSLDPAAVDGFDAVVHLAGENVASGRWSPERKERIRSSRKKGTCLLAKTLAGLARKPDVLVSASAVGYYGDRADEELAEGAEPGRGFLAQVCRDWEAATRPAEDAGIRVVHARIGVVLTPGGGALARMLPPFQVGAGGPIGNGKQWLSWIGIDDVCDVLYRALQDRELRGPVNAVAPNPVRQRDFASALGRVLGRPAFMPLPAMALRLAFGEMAEEVLLASTRAVPSRLARADHEFRHAELEPALRAVLGR